MTRPITRRALRKWGACYSDEQIAALVPRSGLTLEQAARLTTLPIADRLWVARQLAPEPVLRRWAVWCAGRALRHYRRSYPGDNRVRDCLRAQAGYLRGVVSVAQRDAARDAAWVAAWAAAEDAAGDAARTAARAAAWAAAWAAARAAARAAAEDAAGDAENERQLARLVAMLRREGI